MAMGKMTKSNVQKVVVVKRKRHGRHRMPKTHDFKQTIPGAVIYNDPTGTNGFGFLFMLSQLDQVATFGDLFDQYKINKVVIKLMPRTQNTHAPGTAVGTCPSYFYSTIDYDDANVPTTLAELREYERCRVISTTDGKSHSITIKPRIAMAAFSGAFTSYANKGNQWIDCASTGVQHYGWKCIFPPAGTGNAVGSVSYDTMLTFYLSFRNVR